MLFTEETFHRDISYKIHCRITISYRDFAKLSLNSASTQLQLKLRLRLALFPADPATHPARTVVSKTSSVLLQYDFKTTS